jgi:hypothetical protein
VGELLLPPACIYVPLRPMPPYFSYPPFPLGFLFRLVLRLYIERHVSPAVQSLRQLCVSFDRGALEAAVLETYTCTQLAGVFERYAS